MKKSKANRIRKYFFLASQKPNIFPRKCIVVEDADTGVEAAQAGRMKVVGIGSASNNVKATYRVKGLSELNVEKVLV